MGLLELINTIHREDCLFKCAHDSGRYPLEKDAEVDDVFRRAQRDLVMDVLADLSDRNLLILRAVIDAKEPFIKTIYTQYQVLSRRLHEEPF